MSFEGSKAVMIKDISGNVLTVPGGSLSATANVSGQTVFIAQGSGFNAHYITNQSGNLALTVTAGNGITDALTLGTSNMALVASELLGFDQTGSTWGRLRTTASGSVASQNAGINRLLVDITEGGRTVRTRISGYLPVTDVSGGASLGSGVVAYGIKIRNIALTQGGTISGVVWVGGSGTNLAPFSGHGYPIFPGETLDITRVQNLLDVRVVSALSGVFVACYGIDF